SVGKRAPRKRISTVWPLFVITTVPPSLSCRFHSKPRSQAGVMAIFHQLPFAQLLGNSQAALSACICKTLIYNSPPEGNHETLLFFTRACLLSHQHTLGRGRSFLREMETQH